MRPLTVRTSRVLAFVISFACTRSPSAFAGDASDEAREEFLLGVARVKEAQWAQALAHFERSQAKRKHPVTSFNVGLCHRAVGHYVLATRAFEEALAQNRDGGGDLLTPELAVETRALLMESDRAIATIEVSLAPASALVSVDGKPLVREGDAYVAGVRSDGDAEPLAPSDSAAQRARIRVKVDPGVHTLRVLAKGYAEAAKTDDFAKGASATYEITLTELPGTLHIRASVPARVAIGDTPIGTTPLTLERPRGTYLVRVTQDGYVSVQNRVDLLPGEQKNLMTTLVRESSPITKKWWFYGIVAVGAAALVTTTYLLVRTSDSSSAPNGGSLGWVVSPK